MALAQTTEEEELFLDDLKFSRVRISYTGTTPLTPIDPNSRILSLEDYHLRNFLLNPQEYHEYL